MKLRLVSAALASVALLLIGSAATPPAEAAFPGPNGKIVYTDSTQCCAESIVVMNADGSGQTRIAGGASPAWSPDAQKIAFDGIYIMNADGSGVVRVTVAGEFPAWSPDGTKLVFADRDANGDQIWTVNTDGTERTKLTSIPNNLWPAWSPDGTRIAFTSTRNGGGEIWVMNADGGNQRPLVSIADGGGGEPNWSPDGTKIAYTNNLHLLVTSASAGGAGTAITNTAIQAVGDASWSPDGTQLVFQNFDGIFGNQIYRVNADGTGLTQLTFGGGYQGNRQPDWGVRPAPTLTAIAITPANATIAKGTEQQFAATGTFSDGSTADLTGSVTWASSDSGVVTIGAGGLAHALSEGTTTISASKGTVSASTPLRVEAWADLAVAIGDSPDPVVVGQTLTYTITVVNRGPSPATGVAVTDTLPASAVFIAAAASRGSGCTAALGTVACQLGGLAGSELATVTLTVRPIQAGTITNVAAAAANEADPNPANNSAGESTTVNDRNGKIAFATNRDGNFEIYSMNPDGTSQTRLTNNAAADVLPAWSPDGSKIAFASNRGGNTDVYVMNADGSAQTRLTTQAAFDSHPAWSPDGTKLAFESNRDGNFEIYLMNPDGSSQVRLTANGTDDTEPAWSPDAQKIAFTRDHWSIYLMRADGRQQARLTSGPLDSDPAWSPDGAKLAFENGIRDRAGNLIARQIVSLNLDGSPGAWLTTGLTYNVEPAWSPDGRKIAFTTSRDSNRQTGYNLEIYVMNADGSGATRLTEHPALDISPDWQSQ